MLETNCGVAENKLNDLIKRLLIAFCELNVSFNTRLDIYGSVHILCDNLEISSVLLNEHSFKKNGIRVEKNCDNSLKETPARMKKRAKQNTCTRMETPDEEELLIEKEWNDPLPPAFTSSDASTTSTTTIRKINYSNQLITSKCGSKTSKVSPKKLKIFNDEPVNPLLIFLRNDMAGDRSADFLSKFTQGKSADEDASLHPLVSASHTLMGENIDLDHRNKSFTNGYVNFNSRSIFPEPELVCVEDDGGKNSNADAACSSSGFKKDLNDSDKMRELTERCLDFRREEHSVKEERETTYIKTESDPNELDGIHQIANHSTKHLSETLNMDAPVGESCFAHIPDFMMNFIAASKLLQLNNFVTSEGHDSADQPFKCLICSLSFSNSMLLQDHLKSHYDNARQMPNGNLPSIDASEGPSGLPTPATSIDLVVPEANKLFCVVCNLTFRSLDGLKCHINSKHSLQKTYKCRFCPKLFLTRQAAYSHRVKFHSLPVAKK